MATAEQIKMLIKSHLDNDDDRFRTAVLQLAAYEARQGHNTLAREIRTLLDKSKTLKAKVIPLNKDLGDMIYSSSVKQRLSELVVKENIKVRVERILKEYHQQDKLKKHGMDNRRKILLTGLPGTGKTMTASVLATELHLPLCTIMVDKLVTKFMGETSAKLRQIFETIEENQAVYLFDEFDAIGSERSKDNDVGEMRRVLNSFLQFIESDDSSSIIVAATNNLKLLDHALFRRFDDVIHYSLPSENEISSLIKNRLNGFACKMINLDNIVKKCSELSHAEITKACDDSIKEAILNDNEKVDEALLNSMIVERIEAYQRGE